MSAIVAAMVGTACLVRTLRTLAGLGLPGAAALADRHERDLIAAVRALGAASTAAGAGRVVEGRPVKIRACTVDGCGGWIDGAEWHIRVPRKGWRPTRYGGARVWSTAAHDPRPCAWPRPFARGADR